MGVLMREPADSTPRPSGHRTTEESDRERAASGARLERAQARGAEHNVKEAAALARFANRVAAAAEAARRRDRD